MGVVISIVIAVYLIVAVIILELGLREGYDRHPLLLRILVVLFWIPFTIAGLMKNKGWKK